ncbi:MAG: ABC transporter ATP-binding protein [Blastocatellia bacterium]
MVENLNGILVQIQGLKKHYRTGQKVVRAVDGVTFDVKFGETLALVGESGCGKSTTGRCILRLVEPDAGSVTFDGQDVLRLGRRELRRVRRQMQIIFQDPYSSLDPRMSVGRIIEEPLVIHRSGSPSDLRDRVADLLKVVRLSPDSANRYPHEFSGGQRQRIGIARALALRPKFIICDEPVSALDVSVQAQVINLLQDLQEQFGLTYLFISHGLAVVRHIATRVGIMYAGKLVELASAAELFENPLHPYTRALLSAIPIPEPDSKRKRMELKDESDCNEVPEAGCSFYARCPISMAECARSEPGLVESQAGHLAACFAVRSPEQ